MLKFLKKGKFWVYVITVSAIVIVLCIACISLFGGKALSFDATFYYVCYDSPPDDSSIVSVSNLVHSYGGAGYIASFNNKSYVVVSCYYSNEDATAVCNQLNRKGLSCGVVKAEVPERKLLGSAKSNMEKYVGNFNTLYSISKSCYNLANSVDKFEVGQQGAKSVLGEIKTALKGLAGSNGQNCFIKELEYLIAECEDISYGYVFSYDIRRLQIAVCDSIVNVNIY